jgi:hypothetical protein
MGVQIIQQAIAPFRSYVGKHRVGSYTTKVKGDSDKASARAASEPSQSAMSKDDL